jgi:RND family efflux transporter MFP subunit
MSFIFRAISGFVLLTVTVGFIAFGVWELHKAKTAQDNKPSRSVPERSFVVNTATMNAGRENPVITAYGEVRSWRSLVLRTPVAGEVTEISDAFRNGISVPRGERLFVVDPEEYLSLTEDAEAALAEALAEQAEADEALVYSTREVAAARKQLALQENELKRQRQLLERGLATESNVSSTEMAYTSADQTLISRGQALVAATKRVELAKLKIQRAQIAVAESRRNLDETGIYAPFDGVLTGVDLQLGQRLATNEEIATLIDPAALEAVFRVPNSKFARLIGDDGVLLKQDITVELELGEKSVNIPGVIERVDARIEQGQSGRLVYATLHTGKGTVLLPGDFVTVRISEPPLENVSVIPATAATDDGRVLIVEADNRLREIHVEVLRRNENQLIVRPPEFGTTFVVERLPQLASGVKIQLAGSAEIKGTGVGYAADTDTIKLDDQRRAALIAYVENNTSMPQDRKTRVLQSLKSTTVPRAMVERIESSM